MEVVSIREADQMQAGKSEFACGFYSVMMALSMSPVGHAPLLSRQEVISKAEDAYTQYDGPDIGSNTYGMTLQQEYDLLHQVGLHYQAIACEQGACVGWLTCGYPVIVAVAEASVVDFEVGGNPYPWNATGNHVIVLTGIQADQYLVRDSANCTSLYDPNSLRPGPRLYAIAPLQIVSATVVVPPWMPQPTSALPPNEGGPKMPDTSDQMMIDAWNNRTKYFKAIGETLPARDTGIFNAWRAQWIAGHFRGVVESQEYHTVDARGVAVIAQDFGGGICHWYPKSNMAVWV